MLCSETAEGKKQNRPSEAFLFRNHSCVCSPKYDQSFAEVIDSTIHRAKRVHCERRAKVFEYDVMTQDLEHRLKLGTLRCTAISHDITSGIGDKTVGNGGFY